VQSVEYLVGALLICVGMAAQAALHRSLREPTSPASERVASAYAHLDCIAARGRTEDGLVTVAKRLAAVEKAVQELAAR
jgi:hypothetical protein